MSKWLLTAIYLRFSRRRACYYAERNKMSMPKKSLKQAKIKHILAPTQVQDRAEIKERSWKYA